MTPHAPSIKRGNVLVSGNRILPTTSIEYDTKRNKMNVL
ncbi:hypothetical protein NBRC3255_1907 [Gluconobacter thailandicus NBRC 3255]|nr:hypothetical protein NBRC3255_1907 [Gluconobacter thailandicus NBRC 3255]